MITQGYTIFWDDNLDFSKLTDEALKAAIADSRWCMAQILSKPDPFPVDVDEQSRLQHALESELARRGLSEPSES